MGIRRFRTSWSLTMTGAALLALGIFLLLVRLLMVVAYFAASAIVVAGALMLLIGYLLRRWKP